MGKWSCLPQRHMVLLAATSCFLNSQHPTRATRVIRPRRVIGARRHTLRGCSTGHASVGAACRQDKAGRQGNTRHPPCASPQPAPICLFYPAHVARSTSQCCEEREKERERDRQRKRREGGERGRERERERKKRERKRERASERELGEEACLWMHGAILN